MKHQERNSFSWRGDKLLFTEIHTIVPKRLFPGKYRRNQITKLEVREERSYVPYADRFQKGIYQKRIQFMFNGELRKIRLMYCGLALNQCWPISKAGLLSMTMLGGLYKGEDYGNRADVWNRGQVSGIEMIDKGKENGY
jgi:hypothetical protein